MRGASGLEYAIFFVAMTLAVAAGVATFGRAQLADYVRARGLVLVPAI
jgi:Flp pilus assembly pilin Flp